MAKLCLLVLLAAPAAVAAGRKSLDGGASVLDTETSANPIRRVVTMLQNMQKKVTAEGQREEELYDKFKCYCQNGGGELSKSISESTAKVPAVQSSIEEAESQKVQLEAEVKGHQQDREQAKEAMAQATQIREKEAAAFAKEKAEYDANIGAMTGAIGAIEKGMAGNFLQTSGASVLRRLILNTEYISDFDREEVTSFLSGGSDAAAGTDSLEGYIPKSGDIVGILKQLKESMEKSLAEIVSAEDSAIASYKELMAAKSKEVAAATKAIESKLTRIGELGVSIVSMKADLTDTEAALIADQKYLADLEGNCATKKAEYEARVKLRADELVAIAEVIKILNDDDALELFKKTLPSASLLQVASHAADVRKKALALMHRAAPGGSDRARVGLLSLALGGRKVSFAKVIKMIDNMVSILKQEQYDDDNKKEYCVKQMDLIDDKKKGLQTVVSDLTTAIEDMTGEIAQLSEDIKGLAAGIKELDKAVLEATEQRKEENAEFSELMSANTAAKELLAFAKNRLNKFYNPKLYKAAPKEEEAEAVFAQLFTVKVSNGESRENPALLGEAPPPPPETWDAYQKKGQETSGVIAMIDLLIADLDKEMTEAEAEEKASQKEYEQTMDDSAAKRVADTKEIGHKESAKAGLEADLQSAKEEQATKTKELMATEKYGASIHVECDWLIQNYDIRKEARAGEVDALTQAKAVLFGADFSLMQTSKAGRFLRGQ